MRYGEEVDALHTSNEVYTIQLKDHGRTQWAMKKRAPKLLSLTLAIINRFR